MAVERKYERDIDLMLAEEIVVSPTFAGWLMRRTGFADREASVVDVFVSRSDATGESDLVVVYEETGAGHFALLIEDKIDAPLQPDQEKRYRLRASREIDRGDYQAFEVVLCAPRAYAKTHPETAGFDRIVAYEDVSAFLLESDPTPRGRYRANSSRRRPCATPTPGRVSATTRPTPSGTPPTEWRRTSFRSWSASRSS